MLFYPFLKPKQSSITNDVIYVDIGVISVLTDFAPLASTASVNHNNKGRRFTHQPCRVRQDNSISIPPPT